MANEADKLWQETKNGLARKAGFAPLTQAEAQKEFEELPDTKLPDSEIDSIIDQVEAPQAKHTPGKWEVQAESDAYEYKRFAIIVADDEDVDAWNTLAIVWDMGDARLMAAAPALLESLQAIEFAARIDCPRNDAWGNLLKSCRAAIAKARP